MELTAKQYLRQVRDLDIKAENYRRYYERCIKDIASLRSPRLDADKVQSSGSGAGFTDAVEKLVDLQAKTNRMIDRFINKRDKIIREINMLSYPYSAILYKRYVEYKDFDAISREMNDISYSRIIHLHGDALHKFGTRYLDKQAKM